MTRGMSVLQTACKLCVAFSLVSFLVEMIEFEAIKGNKK